ncbi:MAG: DNA integrity scanning protein DisA nucleotide-binding domain protein [Desulfobacterales bacterium]|nr:DNA integrity scanning protein DisA nucleotide-binding domain protein [Desulfobacterales bacterium]
MNQKSYKKLCIANILNGVSDGLYKYSNPSRVALLFAPEPDDPIQVFDPQDLLGGHETKLNEEFLTGEELWRERVKQQISSQPRGHLIPDRDLDMSGLISFAGASSEFFFQVWFTEHHPDLCSSRPTEKWLEQAATLLAHDYNSSNTPINSSDYVLKNYALQAIADHLVDERNQHLGFDTKIQIPSILNHILAISKTKEEGAWARGILFFTDPTTINNIDFLTKIQRHERPLVSNIKHIRKLLVGVERSDRKLVSDGNTIIGITDAEIPEYAIAAHFKGDYGFLRMGTQKVASFSDGNFHSSTREAKMVELEEILLDSNLPTEAAGTLFNVVSGMVHKAGHARHGCTLVIDMNETPLTLSGHVLEPPLSLLEPKNYDLASALMRIDGAVHLTTDTRIHGFACLLDGKTISWENMARGARYNSALRFSAATPKVIVVVVSADRPVSIIYNGIELNAFCRWKPVYQYMPEIITLKKHLNGVLI